MASLDFGARDGHSLFITRRFWSSYILLWTLVAVLLACQSYIGEIVYPGQKTISLHSKTAVPQNGYSNVDGHTVGVPLRFTDHLRWSLEIWYTRATLSPFALWMALKFRFRRGSSARVCCVHILASIAVDASALLAIAELCHVLEPHRPSFSSEFRRALSAHVAFNLLVYWVLVGVVHAWCYYNDAHQQDLRSAKLREELARVRLTVLKSQLHPHFLFNALHSIGALVHEDPALAEDLLLRVSHLLRTFLQDTHVQEVPLRREIGLLDSQLGIERIRFGDRLTTRTEIEETALDCAVPHLIFQPLIENAIRHGIGKHPGVDQVTVLVKRMATSLQLEVVNLNSVLTFSSTESVPEGIGLSNIRSRLRELYDDQYSLRLVNLTPRGVSVRINLPLRTIADDSAAIPEYFV